LVQSLQLAVVVVDIPQTILLVRQRQVLAVGRAVAVAHSLHLLVLAVLALHRLCRVLTVVQPHLICRLAVVAVLARQVTRTGQWKAVTAYQSHLQLQAITAVAVVGLGTVQRLVAVALVAAALVQVVQMQRQTQL
jgi:hypothetical protein